MGTFDDHRLEVELEGEGRWCSDFISYRINSSFSTPTDGWEFVVSSPTDARSLRRRFRPLRPIKLYINGCLQVIGRIDGIEGVGDSGADLRVWGRDYLSDLVDGGVDPSLRFTDHTTMESAILSIFKPYGITTIDDAGADRARKLRTGKSKTRGKSFRKQRTRQLLGYKADYDEGAFELANKIAARHGLMIQPSVDRSTICLVAPDYEQDPLYILRRSPADGGEMETASAKRDWSQVPTVVVATGRGGDAGVGSSGMRFEKPTFGVDAINDFWKTEEIRRIVFGEDFKDPITVGFRFNPKHAQAGNAGAVYRPMFFRDVDARTPDQLESAARRLVAEKVRPTLDYTCALQGHAHRKTGAVYSIDTVAHVMDGIEDVDEKLWAMERTFYNDGRSGPMTSMSFIRPGSFQIDDRSASDPH